MDENEEIIDYDFEPFNITNNLNNQKKTRKILPKLKELNEVGNESFIPKKKRKKELMLKFINADEICKSVYTFLIIYFIESLILTFIKMKLFNFYFNKNNKN